jgi:sortase (surface protein transpeptidase)
VGASAFVLLVVAVAAAAFVFAGGDDDPNPAGDADETPSATSTLTLTPTQTATLRPGETPTPTQTPSPTPTPFDGAIAALQIPRFDVDSEIEVIGLLSNNQLATPDDEHKTGWYDIEGYNLALPGWIGNAVFSAHVDYYPNTRGPFYHLAELEAGDEVVIVMENQATYVYEVVSNIRYDAQTIPMGDILWPKDLAADEERITLITCGGAFQPYSGTSGPGRYLHRDVVVARRVPAAEVAALQAN